MNRTTARRILLNIDIIRAFAEGKNIQFKSSGAEWQNNISGYTFDSAPECYRIKSEPRVIYVNNYAKSRNSEDFNLGSQAYLKKEDADIRCDRDDETIKFVEVLEDEI